MFWVNLLFGSGLEGLPDTLKCHLKAAKKKKMAFTFQEECANQCLPKALVSWKKFYL